MLCLLVQQRGTSADDMYVCIICTVFRWSGALTFGYGCTVYVGVDVGTGDVEVDVIYISFT